MPIEYSENSRFICLECRNIYKKEDMILEGKHKHLCLDCAKMESDWEGGGK